MSRFREKFSNNNFGPQNGLFTPFKGKQEFSENRSFVAF